MLPLLCRFRARRGGAKAVGSVLWGDEKVLMECGTGPLEILIKADAAAVQRSS
jgi:hypothetical protein